MSGERERKGRNSKGGGSPPALFYRSGRFRPARHLAVVALAGLLLLSMLQMFPAAEAKRETAELNVETGATENLQGGDYVAFNSSGRAWFGVIYGTAVNPGPIRVVSLHTRYLGVAEVYDRLGRQLGSDVGIPVVSVAAQYLTNIYEFNDVDGNGLFDYRVLGDRWNPRDITYMEPVFKSVTLSTVWSLSGPAPDGNGGYDFSLSASGLPYTLFGNSTAGGTLENVTFTFHVSTRIKHSDVELPVLRVTVDRGGVVGSRTTGTKRYSAEKLSADFKTDHSIAGWDFDPADPPAGRSLLLESHALLGAVVPPRIAGWIKEQFVSDINGSGVIEFSDSNGTMRDVSDRSPEALPTKAAARNGGISLRDGWQKYGSLSWVSSADVYPDANSTSPLDGTVAYQITGARKLSFFNWKGPGSGMLSTVLLFGGFVYPGGYKVVHDPTFSVVAQLVDWGEALASLLPRGIVGLQLMVAVAGCVAAGTIAISRHGRKR